jgi:DNA-binding NarL/FixJ family response regulator
VLRDVAIEAPHLLVVSYTSRELRHVAMKSFRVPVDSDPPRPGGTRDPRLPFPRLARGAGATRILLVDDHAVVRAGLPAPHEKHAITVAGERSKSAGEIELLRAIAAMAENQTNAVTFGHDNLGEPTSCAATPSPPQLTDREREVLQLLGLRSVAELTKLAICEGLTALD